MPLAGSSASRGITVTAMAGEVTISVDKRKAKIGDELVFSGYTVATEFDYVADVELQIQVGGAWRRVMDCRVGYPPHPPAPGDRLSWEARWTVPRSFAGANLGCRTWSFRAVDHASGAVSGTVSVTIAWRTSITVSAPSTVRAGEAFTISGKLTREDGVGLGGKSVRIEITGPESKSTTVTTARDGSYSWRTSLAKTGDYTIKATFPGEGFSPTAILTAVGGVDNVIRFAVPLAIVLLVKRLA